LSPQEQELRDLKESLQDTQPVGSIVNCCKTLDQVKKNQLYDYVIGLVLWCLMPLLTKFHLYCGGQFYWWKKLEYPKKTTIVMLISMVKINNIFDHI
jgi:hypothetical protein